MKKTYKPKRNPKNTTASISLPKALHKAVLERAEKESRSFSNMLCVLLESVVDISEFETVNYSAGENQHMTVAEKKETYGKPESGGQKSRSSAA